MLFSKGELGGKGRRKPMYCSSQATGVRLPSGLFPVFFYPQISQIFANRFYQFFLSVLSVICGFTVWFLIEARFVS
jgi:hypothetical protein